MAKTISTNQIHPKKKTCVYFKWTSNFRLLEEWEWVLELELKLKLKLMDAPKQVGHLSSRRFQKEGFLRSRPSGCVRVSADLRICVSVCLRCLCVCASAVSVSVVCVCVSV